MDLKNLKKGQGMALGMAMFIPIGVVMWLVTDNPGMIAIGPALGVSVGIALEKQSGHECVVEDKEKRVLFVILGLVVLALAVTFAFFLLQ